MNTLEMTRHRSFAIRAVSLSLLVGSVICAGCADIASRAGLGSDDWSLAPYFTTDEFNAELLTYSHDGLTLHALVATPVGSVPSAGYPTVVANHGYVPDPRRYGIGADGLDRRPGDYYRTIPGLFTSRGFRVVMPDYRGHNSSDGYESLTGDVAADIPRYAADVSQLVTLLPQLPATDTERLYLWSHSMGGPVSMRVLLAQPVFRAATFWSTMSLAEWDVDYARLGTEVIIHHALDDSTTPYRNAAALRTALRADGVAAILHTYASDRHLFGAQNQQLAADRDAAFFRAATVNNGRDND